jgi:hypothetical protein
MLHVAVALAAALLAHPPPPLRVCRLGSDTRLPHLASVLPLLLSASQRSRELLHADPRWQPLLDAARQGEGAKVRLVLQQFGGLHTLVTTAAIAAAVQRGNPATLGGLLAACTDAAAAAAESELVLLALEEVGAVVASCSATACCGGAARRTATCRCIGMQRLAARAPSFSSSPLVQPACTLPMAATRAPRCSTAPARQRRRSF